MATCEYLLLETGDYLLLESGDRLIIGDVPCTPPSTGGVSAGGVPWPGKMVAMMFPRLLQREDEDIFLLLDDD